MDESALLLCNGERPSASLARHCAARVDRVIAADGGANSARRLGIVPDTIVGDCDSLTPGTRRAFPGAVVVKILRQDNTDLEKALGLLAGEGIRKAVILGMTGGRIDFTLANFISFWRYAERMELLAAGEGWCALPVRPRRVLRLRAPRGTTVSFVPLGPCRGVTLTGFAYPLRNAAMRTGETGVSNVVRRSPCSVRVERGAALLLIPRDLRAIPGLWA
jgi:thiamine pyrophosphokinase